MSLPTQRVVQSSVRFALDQLRAKCMFSTGASYGLTSSYGSHVSKMPEIVDFNRFFTKSQYPECTEALQRFEKVADSFGDPNLKLESQLRFAKLFQCQGKLSSEKDIYKSLLSRFENTMPLSQCLDKTVATLCHGFSLDPEYVKTSSNINLAILEKLFQTNETNIQNILTKENSKTEFDEGVVSKNVGEITSGSETSHQLVAWNMVLSSYLSACLRGNDFEELQNATEKYGSMFFEAGNSEGVFVCLFYRALGYQAQYEGLEAQRRSLIALALQQKSSSKSPSQNAEKPAPLKKLILTKVIPGQKPADNSGVSEHKETDEEKETPSSSPPKTPKPTPSQQEDILLREESANMSSHNSATSETGSKVAALKASVSAPVSEITVDLLTRLFNRSKSSHTESHNPFKKHSTVDFSLFPQNLLSQVFSSHLSNLNEAMSNEITEVSQKSQDMFIKSCTAYIEALTWSSNSSSPLTAEHSTSTQGSNELYVLIALTSIFRENVAFLKTLNRPETSTSSISTVIDTFSRYSEAIAKESTILAAAMYPTFRPANLSPNDEMFKKCLVWLTANTQSSTHHAERSMLHISYYSPTIPILALLTSSPSLAEISYALTISEGLMPNDTASLASILRILGSFYADINPINAEGLLRSALRHLEKNPQTAHVKSQLATAIMTYIHLLNTISWNGARRTPEALKLIQKAAKDGIITPFTINSHEGIFISGGYTFMVFDNEKLLSTTNDLISIDLDQPKRYSLICQPIPSNSSADWVLERFLL